MWGFKAVGDEAWLARRFHTLRMASANTRRETGTPSIRILSVYERRCGVVKSPIGPGGDGDAAADADADADECARRNEAINAAVEPLPLVPVMWIMSKSQPGDWR
jgi:hypothetical protein